jgi:hypothetical protein
MKHRHLNHRSLTLAAIDNIIERGGRADWIVLRDQTVLDKEVRNKVLKICDAHACDPYAQRYHLWRHYAGRIVA